ncbi:MAG: hypothetical protein K9L31_02720 [Candidatus Pacebacteria bacterium]|nr:hypothetical protein [Candidatus Paceibacterota bacterium]
MKEINPFKNIKEKELSEVDNIESNGSVFLSDLRELNVGNGGSNVFRVDKKGLYLGGTDFDSATFSVDMDGNAKLLSATISGFITVGGAAADVNSGSTTISGGKITTGSITADKIATGELIVGTNVDIGTAFPTSSAGNLAYRNLVETAQLGTTVISGGYIQTSLINTGAIVIGDLSGTADWQTQIGGAGKPDNNADVTQSELNSGASIDNAKANGTTLISGGYIATGIITASNINTGTLSADRIAAGSISATKLDVDNLSSITANIGSITSGTITGATVSSSSGNDRIVLSSGDYLDFYASGSLKARLTATTSGSGGLKLTSGDIYLANDKSFWIAATPLGSSTYGGIGVSSSNNLLITSGTTNAVYIVNNSGTQMYVLGTTALTVGSSTYSPDIIPYDNGTQDLGDSSHKFDDLFINAIKGTYGEIYLDQSGRIQFTNHCDPSGTGSYNLGGSARYWNEIHYKTLEDEGCLGWFDEGVEMQDGKKVSDIEAIQAIKKDPTKKTIYGVPMLDYKSFPKVSYKKAHTHNGDLYPRDENDIPYIEEYNEKTKKKERRKLNDSVEMTSVFSIMIGALKELDNRLKLAEDEIKLLKTEKKKRNK